MVKPSWTVMRFTEAVGRGPTVTYRSAKPENRRIRRSRPGGRARSRASCHGTCRSTPPQRREPAEVVAVHLAHVPRLGDHLGLRRHRILGDHVQEGRHLVEGALLPGQGRRQVEPEPFDVHLGQPVAHRVHHELQRDRVTGIQRVAAAGRIVIAARVAGRQPVIRRVVDATETQRGPVRPRLGGVVEHHVKQDFEASPVQRVDHRFELVDLAALPARAHGGGIAVVGLTWAL